MAKEVLVTAEKLHKRKKKVKLAKRVSLIILIVLTILFIVLTLVFKGGKFVIQLDKSASRDSSLVIYDFEEDREAKRRLYADEMPFMDNISIKWIPQNIDTEKEGSHNGENYIAYTFHVENVGKEAVNYWYEVVIDDVIKNVDEGIRIMIFLNGDKTVYAKLNGDTKEPEPNTTAFYNSDLNLDEYIAVLEERKNLQPNEPDRITIVVWIEGDDPDTVNALIGGDIKMHMNIREERITNQEELEPVPIEENTLENNEENEPLVEGEMNRKKAKLIYLSILLLFTVAMLSTSTYAWFTSNRVVTVSTINVHVAATGGIEISADGTNWKSIINPEDITSVHDSTYTTSTNQIPENMEPVSTGLDIDSSTGFLKMYYGTTTNNNIGDYILKSSRIIETEGNGSSNDGKFIAFDLFFKVSSETQVYLTNNSQVTYLNQDEGKGIANATRIAFVDEGTVSNGASVDEIQSLKRATSNTVYVWEPNYDTHTSSGIANARNLYGITTQESNANRIIYDGLISEIDENANVLLRNTKSSSYPAYFKTVNISYYTKSDFTNFVPVFTLRSGITKMRIYMWIEGQDVDCENDASYDDIQFDLQLSVNPA